MRAGTGGDEACDFRGRYVQNVHHVFQNQRLETQKLADSSEASKGYKELVIESRKEEGVYGIMKFESGVHRVPESSQRQNLKVECTLRRLRLQFYQKRKK